jgi:hypothetical protein
MANTVSILSYANTFGDWVVTTNAVVRENNDLAANNFVKPTGTLYLNDPTLGLQVANNAVVAGQLQVQGIGSSAYVQNNLRVDNQLYLQNTTLSMVASGQANIGGPLLALSSGTGLAVSNNATVGGTLNVSGTSTLANTNVNGKITVSGQSVLTGNVTGVDSMIVYNDIRAKNITANTLLTVPTANITADATIYGSATVYGQLAVGGNFVISGSTVYNTNNFTISAATGTAINSTFTVNRGTTGANASIRWNESTKYFDMLDVDNGQYYRVLTDEYLSSSISSTSTSNVATSNAIYTVATNLNTANTFLQANDASTLAASKVYTDTLRTYVDTNLTLNNGVNTTQNTNISNVNTYAQAGFALANSTTTYSQAGFAVANTATSNLSANVAYFQALNNTQNTQITTVTTTAGAAFNSGNTTLAYAQAGYASSNTKVATVSGTSGRVTSSGTTAITLDLATAGPGASSATNASLTIDAYGRVTALTSGTAPVTSITGTANQITVTGTVTPTLSLPQSIHTGANFQINSLGVGTGATGTAGEIRATNNITAYYSDDRLKTRLGLIENALDKVNSLNGFYYEANQTAQDLGYTVRKEVGLSAQEVQSILPEIVVPAPIDEKYLTIHYERVVPLLVEAIKELSRQVEELKKK